MFLQIFMICSVLKFIDNAFVVKIVNFLVELVCKIFLISLYYLLFKKEDN